MLCTGYSEYVNKDSSLKMGINGYLVKPFTAEQFACEVNGYFQVLKEHFFSGSIFP